MEVEWFGTACLLLCGCAPEFTELHEMNSGGNKRVIIENISWVNILFQKEDFWGFVVFLFCVFFF